jgi:membrane protease YdiL (CAAX protease family)
MHSTEYPSLDLVAWYHLFFFGVFIPWSAVRSRKRFESMRVLPPRRRLFRSVLVVQVFLLAFSLFVASREGIELFPRAVPGLRDVALGIGVLIAMVAFMLPRWRRAVESRDAAVYTRMPRDVGERALWIGVSATAGFGEEISYRGVMYVLVTWAVHDPWIATLVCAVAFAIGHWVQGWRSVLVIFAFALLFHGLVAATGALYVAMAVHFVYDVVAGLAYGHYGEKLGYPIEGVQPCTTPAS